MRVRIERVVDARRRIVECAAAPLGTLRLVWEGEPLPTEGEHDVELDVPTILEWGREIWRVGDSRHRDEPDRPLLTGTLLGVDQSGVAEIDLRGGLLVIETLGDPPLGAVGGTVGLRPPRVHAHPYDL